jgi:ketosteroid isomerase-like protein
VSETNLEKVRRSYEAFNNGDIEGALGVLAPDVEWQTYIVPGPGGATYHGHDGVRQLWTDARTIFGDFRNDPEELFDAGDRVVAFVCVRGRGSLSGAPVEARIAHLMTFRGGLVVRVESFEDREEALRKAGLRD